MVAAAERAEQAGSEQYHDSHMGAIFKEGFSFSGYERDFLALNLGQGKFLDISGISGVDSISDGRGAVFADLDNDGDLDIFLTTAQREAHYLFRNNVGQANCFLRVTLEGRAAGRDAYGAVVRVKTSRGIQTKLKTGGSGYLSHHDSRLLFGLGQDERAEWIEVTWPGGLVERVEPPSSNSSILVVQGEGARPLAERGFRLIDPLDPESALLARIGVRKGERLPELTLRAADGATVRLSQLLRPGRRTLLNFWATWCAPCARELPELQRLASGLARAGVDLVGVSVDLETAGEVPAYVAARGLTFPNYVTDEAELARLYPRGELTVPLTLLLDSSGRVIEAHSGWSPRAERALSRITAGG